MSAQAMIRGDKDESGAGTGEDLNNIVISQSSSKNIVESAAVEVVGFPKAQGVLLLLLSSRPLPTFHNDGLQTFAQCYQPADFLGQ